MAKKSTPKENPDILVSQPEMNPAADDDQAQALQTDSGGDDLSSGESSGLADKDGFPQTDSENALDLAAGAVDLTGMTPEGPDTQTDFSDENSGPDLTPGSSSDKSDFPVHQTDSENAGDAAEGAADLHASGHFPQTDSEMADFAAAPAANLQLQAEESPDVQTDPGAAPDDGDEDPGSPKSKPKKRSTQTGKKAAKNPDSSAQTPSGAQIRTKKNAFQDESDTADSAGTASRPATRASRPNPTGQSIGTLRSIRSGSPDIVSIDSVRSVESDTDKKVNDYLDLVESLKGRKILSGNIKGVERREDNHEKIYAVVYHGDFKVVIPAEDAVILPDNLRGQQPSDVLFYLLTKRLGAEVDYIVTLADAEAGMAGGNRLAAMAQKRKDFYFGTDRDGYNLMYEGVIAEARVVSSIRAGVFVEVFGAECYIPLRELSYQRWLDASQHFQPGQRVLVKILSINREDRSNIRISASVKQAGENPYEKALRRYTIGNRYVGTVSIVDTTGVFVSLDGGIDCLCSYPKRGRPPRASRVTVRILGIDHETNRIWGAITHMTTAR